MKKLFLGVTLLFLLGQDIWANGAISYIERSWNSDTEQVVAATKTVSSYTVLTESLKNNGWLGVGDAYGEAFKWCVVKDNLNILTLNVRGEAHLILCDGAKLVCTGGVWLEGQNTLYVYSQSDEDKEGKLVVTNSYENTAGIGCEGGAKDSNGNIIGMGNLIIHGGDIDVRVTDKKSAAIGGGEDRGIGGSFIMYGGDLYASTVVDGKETWGAAIGGGYDGGQGAAVNIFGGTVKALSNYGAAIGGGRKQGCGIINIWGGQVTAAGGYGAGMGNGGSWDKAGGVVNIYGGDVISASYSGGAGIGGGYDGQGCAVNIYGGKVQADSFGRGAGIGGGSYGDQGGEITINGGEVSAVSWDAIPEKYEIEGFRLTSLLKVAIQSSWRWLTHGLDHDAAGAGIGGGYRGNGGTVNIHGGYVTAYGGGKYYSGAGIGGGSELPMTFLRNAGGEGGHVLIDGENTYVEARGCIRTGAAIGHGFGDDENGWCHIGDGLKVDYGDYYYNTKSIKQKGTSFNTKSYTCGQYSYVKISKCEHENFMQKPDYKIYYQHADPEVAYKEHFERCLYCNDVMLAPHESPREQCVCGYMTENTLHKVTYYVAKWNEETKQYEYHAVYDELFPKGKKVGLEEGHDVDGNLDFQYWAILDAEPSSTDIWLKDTDVKQTTDIGAVNKDYALFARYHKHYKKTWEWSEDLTSCQLTLVNATFNENIKLDAYVTPPTNSDEAPTLDAPVLKTYTAVARGDDQWLYTTNKTFYEFYPITLYDAADNSSTLEATDGKQVTVNYDRTLYRNGKWNTICLPFSINDLKGTPFEGAHIRALINAEVKDGVLKLDFSYDNDYITAGVPYLVKWDEQGENVENISVKGAVIKNQLTPATFDCVSFEGTYSPRTLAAGDKSVFFLGNDNKFYWPQDVVNIGACRGYLKLLNGITLGVVSNGDPNTVRSIVLNIDDPDGTTTEITIPVADTPYSTDKTYDEVWYTIGGLLLDREPTKKGIYIYKGKKIIK